MTGKTSFEYPRCAECNRRLRLCEHDRTRHCGVCDPCRLPVTLAELTDAERREWAEFLDADLIRRSRFDGSLSFRYTEMKLFAQAPAPNSIDGWAAAYATRFAKIVADDDAR